jgi:ABC-type branched-subunit amino acid transport system ATPase component
VKFRYNEKTKYIFDNYNREIDLKDKIIGITGLSGNGKSSFVKLIMKLHKCNEGAIYIDGEDIANIDSYYLRENITYVNQNSRLFDRKIVDNILYGCNDMDKCNAHLREILAYSKIQELYRNLDIDTAEAGPLGENLSGGQRQIANIISGLINPTKMLILDEPTNALDPELKNELLNILKQFKSYKKCIMIITHDKDVYPLFDEKIEI